VTLFLRYQLSTKGKCELIYLEGFKFKAVNQLKVNHQDISGASVWQSPIVDPTIYRFLKWDGSGWVAGAVGAKHANPLWQHFLPTRVCHAILIAIAFLIFLFHLTAAEEFLLAQKEKCAR